MLNAGAVAENWQLSTQSVVNLARLQVYHTDHKRICLQHRDAARRTGLSALILVETRNVGQCPT